MELEQLNKEIDVLKAVVCKASTHPRYGAMKAKNPIAALEIPNRLFLLWEEKRSIQGQFCTSVSKHSELINCSIEGGKLHEVSSLEKRLQKQSSYICKQHTRLQFGSRTKLEEGTTKILLFKDEAKLTSKANSRSVEENTLQFYGIVYVS